MPRGYCSYEQLFQKIESRSRPVNGAATLDVPDFDWISDVQDTVGLYRRRSRARSQGSRPENRPELLETNTLDPFVAGVSSIWLGNNLRDYTAHMMGASVTYRFK